MTRCNVCSVPTIINLAYFFNGYFDWLEPQKNIQVNSLRQPYIVYPNDKFISVRYGRTIYSEGGYSQDKQEHLYLFTWNGLAEEQSTTNSNKFILWTIQEELMIRNNPWRGLFFLFIHWADPFTSAQGVELQLRVTGLTPVTQNMRQQSGHHSVIMP